MYSILLNEPMGSPLHIIIRSTHRLSIILNHSHRICYVPTNESFSITVNTVWMPSTSLTGVCASMVQHLEQYQPCGTALGSVLASGQSELAHLVPVNTAGVTIASPIGHPVNRTYFICHADLVENCHRTNSR